MGMVGGAALVGACQALRFLANMMTRCSGGSINAFTKLEDRPDTP